MGDDRVLAEADVTGLRGAVTQIREYPGHRFRYSVRSLTGDDDDEEHLLAAGERATADIFALPGGFRVRQVVTVSAGFDNTHVARRTGVVDASYTGDGAIGIRIEELGGSILIWPEFLTATGDLLPAAQAWHRAANSTRVSDDGEIKGYTSYIVVDEIDRYL